MYTDITILVDESSSMSGARTTTLSALREFIDEQKKVNGRCNLSIYSFNTSKRKLIDGDIQNINLNEGLYQPNGMTALYDATCEVIDELGVKLNNMPSVSRPDKVLVIILTDGEENSSRKKIFDVKNRIQHQENVYSWNFVYLGADFNATEYSTNSGLDNSRVYNYDKADTKFAFMGLSSGIACYRNAIGVNKLCSNFSEQVETAALLAKANDSNCKV